MGWPCASAEKEGHHPSISPAPARKLVPGERRKAHSTQLSWCDHGAIVDCAALAGPLMLASTRKPTRPRRPARHAIGTARFAARRAGLRRGLVVVAACRRLQVGDAWPHGWPITPAGVTLPGAGCWPGPLGGVAATPGAAGASLRPRSQRTSLVAPLGNARWGASDPRRPRATMLGPGASHHPQVVFVCTEVAPWSQVGGLADVAAALPAALAAR
jgi:hypothetical protein